MDNAENKGNYARITLYNDNDVEVDFYIVDKVNVNDRDYFLAVDNADENKAEEMVILYNVSDSEDEMVLQIVEDESELKLVVEAFEKLMGDTELLI